MMVVPTYKDYLEMPGGYIECGETPTQAAAREVKEEVGIICTVRRSRLTNSATRVSCARWIAGQA